MLRYISGYDIQMLRRTTSNKVSSWQKIPCSNADYGGFLWSGMAKDYAIQQAYSCNSMCTRATAKPYGTGVFDLRLKRLRLLLCSCHSRIGNYSTNYYRTGGFGKEAGLVNIVERNVSSENYCFDRQRGRNSSDY